MNFWIFKKHKNAGIKHLSDPNGFIECLDTMDDVYKNIDDYNPSRKKKNCVWWHDCRYYDK